jgi:GDP-L-fucose synthase
LASSHVLPALIRKIHAAKIGGEASVVLWGTGKPRREFLHVDDMAAACMFLVEHYDGYEHVNVGCGEDLEIRELARIIGDVIGFKGKFSVDTSKPDGVPRKLMDSSKLNRMGWSPTRTLVEGVRETYAWFLQNQVANV